MQNVTHWFLVGYILGCRWWYMCVVRVISLVGCKDYLSSHELSSLTYITPNESYNVLWTLYAEGLLWDRNCAQKGSVNSVGSVRERTPQELSSALSLTVGAFYFSQIYTDEQNTQRATETLSQPISQSVTANLSWKASVTSVCRRPSVGSKLCAKMLRELCVLCERKNSPAWEKNLPPHVSNFLFLTEKHRWTEYTKAHRDIKSTDFTERYS